MHIAGLISENLKLQGLYTHGCNVFRQIAPNIENEEINRKMADVLYNEIYEIQYTEVQYLEYLCKAADMFKLGDRLEALPEIFKLSIDIYERNREVLVLFHFVSFLHVAIIIQCKIQKPNILTIIYCF